MNGRIADCGYMVLPGNPPVQRSPLDPIITMSAAPGFEQPDFLALDPEPASRAEHHVASDARPTLGARFRDPVLRGRRERALS